MTSKLIILLFTLTSHKAFAQQIQDNIIFPEWTIDNEVCYTPDGRSGECIIINQCQPILDFLMRVPKPLSKADRSVLQSYHCGFESNTAKVCCPNGPVGGGGTDSGGVRGPSLTPDVSRHRNLPLLPSECGTVYTGDRLLNGNKTMLFEFPWMALISYREGNKLDFKCGGTLISRRYVLTAAHCVTNLGQKAVAGVRLGEYNILTSPDCEQPADGSEEYCAPPHQDVPVERIIAHPEYSTTKYWHDIALIRLARDANINEDSIIPICLPINQQQREVTMKKLTVTGWGRTETGANSPLLLKLDLPLTPNDECKKLFNPAAEITLRQICAGGKNSQDSCAGDSGGPLQTLAAVGSTPRYFQYGVVSFGPKPCGRPGIPGVYTRVVSYMDWILDNMTN